MNSKFEQHFKQLGYGKLTQIQEQVYEPIKAGRSVLGLSPTGSGKTVAFTVPLVERVEAGAGTQVLVFEPSQELGMQTTSVLRDWAKLNDAKVLALTGGANVKRQIEKLKQRPEIVVGTPGRILNLVNDRKLKLNHLMSVVIDEADDLLNDNTLDDVRTILNQGPSDVQLTFFSATDTEILHDLKKWFVIEPELIDVRKIDDSAGDVEHRLLTVSRAKRNQMLNRLMHIKGFKALVFFDQLPDLTRAYSYFRHNHVTKVASLTSNQNQIQRQKAITGFKKGHYQLLLTTDVAARGLDIKKLPAVVNFDLPKEANQYVHRVGRTGRMGEPGLVINFGDDHDFRDLKRLLKDMDYQFTPAYFDQNRLVEKRPVKAQPAPKAKSSDAKPVKAAVSGQPVKPDASRRHSSEPKASARPTNPKPQPEAVTKRQRKHRNKKHLKNKGMRKKWRDADK